MILEFSIANTFSINEKQTISFESAVNDENTDAIHCVKMGDKKILKMACLYGANASGKTKMIEALYFYIDFMINSFTDIKPNGHIQFQPFRFNSETQKQPGTFEIIFYAKDMAEEKNIRYDYTLQLTDQAVEVESLYYAPKGQKKLIFERTSDNTIKWGTDVIGAKKIIAEMTRQNCSVISAGAQAKQPILKHIYDHISERFKGLILPSFENLSGYVSFQMEKNEEFRKKVVRLLSASDMGNITDIKIKSQQIPDEIIKQMPLEIQQKITKNGEKPKARKVRLVHHYSGIDYELPLSLESAGTVKMMDMSVPLYNLTSSHSMVLIDELETSFHQELLYMFIQLFLEASQESQMLFTTHNQDLLDSDLLRNDEIWFCYKTDKGNSKYNCLTDYTGVRKEASRKKLYQADKFGALPNVDINLLRELFSATKDRKDTK